MTQNDKLSKALETQTAKPKGLQDLIRESTKELGKALPAHLSPERLVRIALTSIRLNPELTKCTPESFLGSLFVLAQLGLEPVAGRAYLLPFNNKRKDAAGNWSSVKEVQALVGYKGLVDLFYRHESALSLDMQTVHANDEFKFQYGTSSELIHRPAMKDRGAVIGFYAVAKMKGGASAFKFMSLEDCLEHGKKHSKTYDKVKKAFYPSSPWASNMEGMCLKTVLIQLAKLLPLSIEMQQAIQVDETSRDFRKGIDSALDMPVTTDWQEAEIVEQATEPEKPASKANPEPNKGIQEQAQEPDSEPSETKEQPENVEFQEITGAVEKYYEPRGKGPHTWVIDGVKFQMFAESYGAGGKKVSNQDTINLINAENEALRSVKIVYVPSVYEDKKTGIKHNVNNIISASPAVK